MGPQKRRPSHASSRWTVSLSLPSAAMLPMPYALSPSATSVSRAHTCAAFVRRVDKCMHADGDCLPSITAGCLASACVQAIAACRCLPESEATIGRSDRHAQSERREPLTNFADRAWKQDEKTWPRDTASSGASPGPLLPPRRSTWSCCASCQTQ